jgi:hypothetical protein
VAIAALAVWALTAGAGVYLLTAVIAAKRATAGARTAPAETVPVPPPSTRVPPPIPRSKVKAPPGEHPLLEFCHPALGITGLACWFAFVATHDRTFAWIALAVLLVTIGAGLGWLLAGRRAAREQADGGAGRVVPAHRIVLHGLAAATTCGLAIAALAASHG